MPTVPCRPRDCGWRAQKRFPVLTAALGRKHYPIPYNWGVVLLLVVAGLGVWGLASLLPEMGLGLKILVHSAFVLLYVGVAFVIFVLQKRRSVA